MPATPQHANENIYWLLNDAPVQAEQRVGTTPDLNYVDLDLIEQQGIYIVDTANTLMWDNLGKNIYPSADRDKDLLIKLSLSTYLSDFASDVFFSFFDTLSNNYGLQTQAGTAAEVTEVWLNAAKQIDCLVVVVSGTTYYYDDKGNVISGGTPDMQLCAYVEAAKYHELSDSINGYSAYMADTFDGTYLKPQLALTGNSANVGGVYIAPSLNVMYYAGTIGGSSTPYKWDASGNEITTMAVDKRLIKQVGVAEYSS